MATILLIDDDESFRDVVAAKLASLGHRVLEAGDGRAGAKIFRADEPDLVITDLVMPEQEGIETIMELRGLRPTVKIIAMTGNVRADRRRQYLEVARQLGAMAVLEKPFTAGQLEAAVGSLLP